MNRTKKTSPAFSIIRAKDLPDFAECEMMVQQPMTEIETEGAIAARDAGMLEGAELKVFFEMPGMSLTHVWFKSGYPLPRHSHDSDCLYYILAGALRIGTEELEVGDGFFVGKDVPYSYTPGDEGVELLEFRGSNAFDIKFFANNLNWWTKAATKIGDKRKAWSKETRPSAINA